MPATALTFTDQSWDADVLDSRIPVLVDFWGERCPACHSVARLVDALAEEFEGALKVGKLKVEHNLDTAVRYQVRGIPTFLLFKDGRVVEQKLGALSKSEFVKMIDQHVQSKSRQ